MVGMLFSAKPLKLFMSFSLLLCFSSFLLCSLCHSFSAKTLRFSSDWLFRKEKDFHLYSSKPFYFIHLAPKASFFKKKYFDLQRYKTLPYYCLITTNSLSIYWLSLSLTLLSVFNVIISYCSLLCILWAIHSNVV